MTAGDGKVEGMGSIGGDTIPDGIAFGLGYGRIRGTTVGALRPEKDGGGVLRG